ncbi:hypothetical protein [Nocardia sp. NPDC005998]|uniref:hypothetical protein n=1 Tax=Nocardia sp. NPDC005998 TaxID=3156894 RepID=UPI0033A659D5
MKTIALVAVASATVLLGACSSHHTTSTSSPAPAAVSGAAQPASVSHKLGDRVDIPDMGLDHTVTGSEAVYTVSNLHRDGQNPAVDLDLKCTSGTDCAVRTFKALTVSGKEVDQVTYSSSERPARFFKKYPSLSVGELRTGAVVFDTTEDITRVILYYGTDNPPVATWSLK